MRTVKMKKPWCVYLLLIFLTACAGMPLAESPSVGESGNNDTAASTAADAYTGMVLKPYDDLSALGFGLERAALRAEAFSTEDIYTYSFDEVVFEGAEAIKKQVMESGKNPGLGVRSLHEQKIDGEGVTVAIIDQNLLPEHPEYSGKIVAYYDSGCEVTVGSMHGPAVLSILAGETLGVAPGANVYYAAAPSWKGDAVYYADCLYWIVEQNRALPKEKKIRLVSVSSAPEEGLFSHSELWREAVSAAQAEGILVLDCRSDVETGFVMSAYYNLENPEDVALCQPGWPDEKNKDYSSEFWRDFIFAPSSYRTSARAYEEGAYGYGYDGSGGRSWAVPYAAGVLALGWQVAPEMDAGTIKELLYQSCYVNSDGNHIIDPVAFVELVEATKAP